MHGIRMIIRTSLFFCQLQLGRSMSDWSQHWRNAEIIAKIPEDQLKTMQLKDFEALGMELT